VADDDYANFACELMSGVGRVVARRMFGGQGLYLDGRMVALVADGRLYLKIDAQTRAAFEAAGSSPFVYDGKGKPVTMSYWLAPDEALDDPALMKPWARRAVEAAARAAAAKPTKPRPKQEPPRVQ
jgi:DNA transformation protein and related proteins